jgi:hypothetical protein
MIGLGSAMVSGAHDPWDGQGAQVGSATSFAILACGLAVLAGLLLLRRTRLARLAQCLAAMSAASAGLCTLGLRGDSRFLQVLLLPAAAVLLFLTFLVLSRGATKPLFRHDQETG